MTAALLAAPAVGSLELLSGHPLRGLFGLGGWLFLFLTCGVAIAVVGRAVFKLNDELLAQRIARLAPALAGGLAIVLMAWLGASSVMALGALLGLLLFGGTRPAKEPTGSQIQAARSAYKEAARNLESYDLAALEELEAELSRLIVKAEMAVGSHRPTVARLLTLVADHCYSQQKLAAAEALFRRAQKVFFTFNCVPEAALVGYNLALVCLKDGRVESGIEECEEALDIVQNPLLRARLLATLAELRAASADPKAAADAAVIARSILLKESGEMHPETLQLTHKAIDYLVECDQNQQASGLVAATLQLRDEIHLLGDDQYVHLLLLQARWALADYATVLATLRRHGGCEHPDVAEILAGSLPHLLPDSWTDAERSCWTALVSGDQNEAVGGLRDQPALLQRLDASGWSALHWVVFWGHERLFESLVFHQNISFPRAVEDATLVAARWRRRKMLAALLRRGGSAQACDTDGRTLAHRAAMAGDARTLDLLAEHSLDVEALDNRQRTPLHLAAHRGHDEVVVELLAAGSNPDRQDSFGLSPLHLALCGGHFVTAELLLNNGARLGSCQHDKVVARVLKRVRSLGEPRLLELVESR